MKDSVKSIRDILTDELNKRRPITNIQFSADKIFEKDEAAEWMGKLLDCNRNEALKKRIEYMSPERISHAIATYLLGIAIKEGLDLKFEYLPRLFSYGIIGDAFYFFWSVVCLCHDLGFQYEKCKLDKQDSMDEHEKRCELLEIEYDLFKLSDKELQKYDIASEEEKWILDTIELARKYDAMRRKTKEKDKSDAKIDHGIAGALITYDILMKQYDRTLSEKMMMQPEEGYRDIESNAAQPLLAGEILSNASHRRFAACSIMIACTVARHNMWIASEDDVKKYKRYGLHALCEGGENVSVSAEKRLEQMLFMLDYLDTIDPVKGIYTRRAEDKDNASESERPTEEELSKRRDLLLDGIRIEFKDDYQSRYRWGYALKYRRFVISIDKTRGNIDKEIFNEYCERVKGIDGWLKTKAPVFKDDAGFVSDVTYYYPFFFREKKSWPGGITENEISALCLYEGCGGGKADKFHQCHNAYQTVNLLMMKGLEGEKVRICVENQNPQGFYIQEWEKTLEVMTDIFVAQCKYMKYCENKCRVQNPDDRIYRVDRQVNFDMMKKLEKTFAFTSTARSGYLEHIARQKQDLLLLEIAITGKIPYVDYEEVLGEEYVYLNEQEVLFPPFVKIGKVKELAVSETERKQFSGAEEKKVSKYYIQFDGFEIRDEMKDEMTLIERLNENKEVAAAVLDKITMERKTDQPGLDIQCYREWKEDFQALVMLCFGNIWKIYGGEQV